MSHLAPTSAVIDDKTRHDSNSIQFDIRVIGVKSLTSREPLDHTDVLHKLQLAFMLYKYLEASVFTSILCCKCTCVLSPSSSSKRPLALMYLLYLWWIQCKPGSWLLILPSPRCNINLVLQMQEA